MIRGKYEVYSGRPQKTDAAIPKKPLMITFLPDGRLEEFLYFVSASLAILQDLGKGNPNRYG